ncbi:MAG: DNA alkylation repair protein [Acidimicrobiales bacterium]
MRGGEPEAAAEIDRALAAGGNPTRAERERAYLKSRLTHYGASVPHVRAVARRVYRDGPPLTHDELVALAAALWARPVHELRLAAAELLCAGVDLLDARDAPLLERLLRESQTWALADRLAIGVAGELAGRDAAMGAVLDRWVGDAELWIRRSALLALLPSLRRGESEGFGRFSRYADVLLDEQEFFIRKAIGWALREAGRRRPELVAEWVRRRATRCSTVTLREALKPLTPPQQAEILAARQRGGKRGPIPGSAPRAQ